MAAHGFNEAQMACIKTTIDIKTDRLQDDLKQITDNAQEAFDLAQSKLQQLFVEATQTAGRVDAQVN